MVSTGEYTNRDGEKKKQWCQVGIMMQDEDDPERISLKFVMPLPMTDSNEGYAECWVNAYPLDDNNNSNTSSGSPPTSSEPPSPPPSSNHDDGSSAFNSEVDGDEIDDIPF